jgi:trk system potassium uptake protein TrkA
MQVIVIGAGEVGTNLARTLAADGHKVTIVDGDPVRCTSIERDIDAFVEQGNGASPLVLKKVGAERADLIASVTQVDEVNLIAAMGAKQLNPDITTIARVRDPDFAGAGDARGSGGGTDARRGPFGIDFVIDPDEATARDIAEAVLLPGAVSVEYFGDGRLALAEVIVGPRSPLPRTALRDRDEPMPAYIVGWTRAGEPHLTHGDDRLEVGDHLTVVAARRHIHDAAAFFAGQVRTVRSATIFGGGRIGLRLAKLLEERNVHTTILERDADRARVIAEQLRSTTVINDEGLSRAVLVSNRIDDADAFIASAGDDRANLLAALNAKEVGADLCLSVVSREEFIPLVDALEIDAAFSPRLITAEAILRFVHGKALKAMHLLRSGFEVLEMEVEPGAPIAGRELAHTSGLLAHCRVGAILRGEEVLVPRGGGDLREGDRVLMLGTSGTLAGVEKAFSTR